MRSSRALLGLFCLLICAYLLAPIFVVVGASFNAGPFLTFPPRGLSLRWFAAFLNNQVFIDAIVRSLWLALAATAISGVRRRNHHPATSRSAIAGRSSHDRRDRFGGAFRRVFLLMT